MNAPLNEPNLEPRQGLHHTLLLCSLPLLLMVACTGCEQNMEALADIDPAGTYTLASVDGNPVPCTLTHQGQSMAIQSGVFMINADGSCSSKVTFSVESGEEVSREVKAGYTQEGSTLTMKWEGAGMTTGTVERGTFTMNNEGMILSYRK